MRMNSKNGAVPLREGKEAVCISTETKYKLKEPSLYKILLLNDDFTPMEFVVMILEHYFAKNKNQATKIMLHVHNHGFGECGTYTYEIAETKINQVLNFSCKYQYPLQCIMEKK